MSIIPSLSLPLNNLTTAPLAVLLLIALGGVVLLLAVAVAAFCAGRAVAHASFRHEANRIRQDALKRSRAVLGGQAGEQVAPFLPGFPCNPADARFVGKPIDFIAFPGAAAGQDIEEILLIEVKTGDAQLSARERQIKRAVEENRVRYVEYRI
ncbi:MAG: Holliday junction resolvase [Treponema sp.]|nr:Holliday junction resolvase [Treponema sp.]